LIDSLTPRERQVLQLIAAGRSTKDLAKDLGIAFKTAACHRQRVLDKCGAVNTADLVVRAFQEGFVGAAAAARPAREPAPEPEMSDLNRMRRSCEKSQRYRALLIAEVVRAQELQEECQAARMQLHAERENLVRTCKKLLATLRTFPVPG
jgi:DNA-binding CsgD family transcriptional regulator